MIQDEIYLEKNEEGDHHFNGQIKVKNTIYYVEGITINTAFAEMGGEPDEMLIDYNTEIEISEIFSGVDCENTHDEVEGLLEALVQL